MTHGSLALRLRVLRAEQALTIEQAAARAGVTPETLSDAERGRRHPYLPTLRKIAKGYNISIKELLAAEAEQEEELETETEAEAEVEVEGEPEVVAKTEVAAKALTKALTYAEAAEAA